MNNPSRTGVNLLYAYPQLLRMDLYDAFRKKSREELEVGRIDGDMNALLSLALLSRQVPFNDVQTICYSSLEGFKYALERRFELGVVDAGNLNGWRKRLEEIDKIDMWQKNLVTLER